MRPPAPAVLGLLLLMLLSPGEATKKPTPCKRCRELVDKFNQGMVDTAKKNFGGGNTAWEEKTLSKYEFSEVRLLEIMEGLCGTSDFECNQLLEEHEGLLETWWLRLKKKYPDLFEWFCVKTLKVCCAPGTYGPDCLACQGGSERPCSGNGHCSGDGSRQGDGSCQCHPGYRGPLCADCMDGYFNSLRNETHSTCSAPNFRNALCVEFTPETGSPRTDGCATSAFQPVTSPARRARAPPTETAASAKRAGHGRATPAWMWTNAQWSRPPARTSSTARTSTAPSCARNVILPAWDAQGRVLDSVKSAFPATRKRAASAQVSGRICVQLRGGNLPRDHVHWWGRDPRLQTPILMCPGAWGPSEGLQAPAGRPPRQSSPAGTRLENHRAPPSRLPGPSLLPAPDGLALGLLLNAPLCLLSLMGWFHLCAFCVGVNHDA
ncbi:protein disulfide isomerase CRELD2 isoform X2 [Balaenoptera musculus]|uniref:Protein disulfide isomerase CRELD2 isoform X2 n=1 Tax=Balaenoptera musculus TaxID=9771 RepID=A0A8B8YFT3_BALMU|nr:protein disulfide isomerase CRELD2 isoform X2 [Balaenoptera musculus]